jgi:subtilase family serine protease
MMLRLGTWRVPSVLLLLVLGCLLQACTSVTSAALPTATPGATATLSATTTPASPGAYTPADLRLAYHVATLTQQGYTGKGQTIIDMVCFGNPQVQSDLDAYSQAYGLPHTAIQVVAPLGANQPPQNAADQQFQASWALETSLDVEMYHALAPNANIVVLVAPICAAEGIVGLPQARQELQYVIDHHLGNIIAISGGTSEVTLSDAASRAELRLWDPVLQTAATQANITILVSSGDNGATDYKDIGATQLSTKPTTSFPTDSPWVTSVGGSSLQPSSAGFTETAWGNDLGASGGGFSAFYSEPSYQQTLPSADQALLQGRRGVPDIAADADPVTGVRVYLSGHWEPGLGGTSIAAPIWAGIIAVGDQLAGKPLGFLNPALYSLGESSKAAADFNDITSGNNTRMVNGVTVPGYAATPGWDPITGWGTPNAATLLPDLITALGK